MNLFSYFAQKLCAFAPQVAFRKFSILGECDSYPLEWLKNRGLLLYSALIEKYSSELYLPLLHNTYCVSVREIFFYGMKSFGVFSRQKKLASLAGGEKLFAVYLLIIYTIFPSTTISILCPYS
jgi:hypothetical protein